MRSHNEHAHQQLRWPVYTEFKINNRHSGGGEAENLRTLCRTHNLAEARRGAGAWGVKPSVNQALVLAHKRRSA